MSEPHDCEEHTYDGICWACDPDPRPPALKAWRRWAEKVGLDEIDCIECHIGRACLRTPPCEGAET